MAAEEGARPVASVAAALAGIDLAPLIAWFASAHEAHEAHEAPQAIDLAASLRVLGVPEKLLPRAEDRAGLGIDRGEGGLSARLEAREIGFRFGSPRFVPALVAYSLVATMHAAPGEASARVGVSLTLGKDGVLVIEGTLPIERGAPRGEARITATNIEPAWLIALVRALTGISRLRREEEEDGAATPAGTFVLTRESRFGAELARGAKGTTLTVTMKTAASALSFGPLVIGAPATPDDVGTPLEGRLAIGDVYRMNLLPPPSEKPELRPLAGAVVELTALVRGPLERLTISAFASAARLELGMHDRGVLAATSPVFVVEDAAALLAVSRERLAWHRLAARAYGGTVGSEGTLGLTALARGVSATAALRDVDAGALPIDAARRVSLIAQGRLALDLQIVQSAGTPPSGSGALVLDQAIFPVLARGQVPLAKYGLRLPSETASAPAACTITYGEHGWSFGEVYAAAPGCVATGRLDVDPSGALDGALVVALGKELLETSSLTSLLTERLTIPVRITGRASAPVVDADLAATFGSFMTNNRVAAVFRSKETARPPAAPRSELAPDPHALIARDVEGEAALLRAWVRAGADWNDLPPR